MNTLLRLRRCDSGAEFIEMALAFPLLLLVVIGITEFGMMFQRYEVLTNAAREAARVAVLPNSTSAAAITRARAYMTSGQLPNADTVPVTVTAETLDLGGGTSANASRVTVNYPFQFVVLQPVVQLLVKGSTVGAPLTMTASAVMRNE